MRVSRKIKKNSVKRVPFHFVLWNTFKWTLLGSIIFTAVSTPFYSAEMVSPMIYPYRAHGWPVPIVPWIPYVSTDIGKLFFGNFIIGSFFVMTVIPDLIFWGFISSIFVLPYQLKRYTQRKK